MPFDIDLVAPAVARYRRERDRYVKLADRVAEICRTDICEDNAIRAQITFRVKSAKSFEGKLHRFSQKADRNYKTVDDIFGAISDLAGVRVATYRHEDCAQVAELVRSTFRGPGGDEVAIDEKDRNAVDPANYYRATHAQVCLPEDELVGTYDNLDDLSCEIQICSMMAHVWNEIEHDIGYKPDAGEPGECERVLLQNLGMVSRQGDTTISWLMAAYAHRVGAANAAFGDVHDFVSRMQQPLGLAELSRNSGQVFDLLRDLRLNSPDALQAALGHFDWQDIGQKIAVFNDWLTAQGENQSLVAGSADAILMHLFRTRLADVIESHRGRVGRGRGRPTRLYSLARRYDKFLQDRPE